MAVRKPGRELSNLETLDLGLLCSRTARTNVCCVSHEASGVPLWQPELTKTHGGCMPQAMVCRVVWLPWSQSLSGGVEPRLMPMRFPSPISKTRSPNRARLSCSVCIRTFRVSLSWAQFYVFTLLPCSGVLRCVLNSTAVAASGSWKQQQLWTPGLALVIHWAASLLRCSPRVTGDCSFR